MPPPLVPIQLQKQGRHMKPTEYYDVHFRVQAATVRSLRKQQLILTQGDHFFVELPFSLPLASPAGPIISNIVLLPPKVFESLNPTPVPDDEPASVADGTTQTVTAKEELDAQ